VYLRTSPETCFNRIQKRARKEENKVSLTYLKSIHEKHDIWLKDKRHIVLDGEKDFINDEDVKEDYINRILSLTKK